MDRDLGRKTSGWHGRYESDGIRKRHERASPRRSRSAIREGSEERRARIEQLNREREERQ